VDAPVAWFEITGQDPNGQADFSSKLLDWSVRDSGYLLIGGGSMSVGDLRARPEGGDRHGPNTPVRPTDAPGEFGKFAAFTDPEGHPVGPRS
jgi:predicted enzyme related to lactoylglutathione lyase